MFHEEQIDEVTLERQEFIDYYMYVTELAHDTIFGSEDYEELEKKIYSFIGAMLEAVIFDGEGQDDE